jgi:hypothetical protein
VRHFGHSRRARDGGRRTPSWFTGCASVWSTVCDVPGSYAVNFDGSNLSTGIYFYRLTAGAQSITNKMMLLK